MSEPTTLLWVDIETTGLDRSKDWLLEVAVFATSPDLMFKGHERQWLISPVETTGDPDTPWEEEMLEVVRDMHTKSGLIHDIKHSDKTISEQDFQSEFILYLNELKEALGHDRVTMAGSGVGPFDLPFLIHNFPELEPYFTYYVMDVGVIGRFFRNVIGAEFPERPTVSHRAMSDLEDHFNEMLDYVSICSKIFQNDS